MSKYMHVQAGNAKTICDRLNKEKMKIHSITNASGSIQCVAESSDDDRELRSCEGSVLSVTKQLNDFGREAEGSILIKQHRAMAFYRFNEKKEAEMKAKHDKAAAEAKKASEKAEKDAKKAAIEKEMEELKKKMDSVDSEKSDEQKEKEAADKAEDERQELMKKEEEKRKKQEAADKKKKEDDEKKKNKEADKAKKSDK